jgi:hypothetical protein
MTWTKETPNTASWTKPTNSTTWVEGNPNSATWLESLIKSFLLMEDGFKLLQDDGAGILLELSTNSIWTEESAGAGGWSKV